MCVCVCVEGVRVCMDVSVDVTRMDENIYSS